ncbi:MULTISPECIES: hypothetical protein [unclassified Chelatococcus]|uniref:hypothetical protein n=1 Tax=unclassified Chelatococcus TaxID=2638111 RepID=UPI001BCD4A38|nr:MULTISPECIES: hypothetical protein [unclassified Chelatococcus]MBS7700270.1 hypothetical protein [Chelatococcus sp. YT9]MBX3558241.1 hypothetical protein [Chelatococcus sp.]
MPAQPFTAQMYNAFLGRAPEPNGYAWWVSLYRTMTETAFINAWAATPEAKALKVPSSPAISLLRPLWR